MATLTFTQLLNSASNVNILYTCEYIAPKLNTSGKLKVVKSCQPKPLLAFEAFSTEVTVWVGNNFVKKLPVLPSGVRPALESLQGWGVDSLRWQ